MMSISFDNCDHEALLLELPWCLGDNPTQPPSPAPSNAVGKTPTTDYCLADLVPLYMQMGALGLCVDSILGQRIHVNMLFSSLPSHTTMTS